MNKKGLHITHQFLKSDNKKGKIFIVLIFIVFLSYTISNFRDIISLNLGTNNHNLNIFSISKSGLSQFSYSLKLLALPFLPMISITLYELSISKYSFITSLKNTSIGRVFKADGKNLADIWYFFLYIFKYKFKTIIIFMTLGGAQVNQKLSGWLSLKFESIFPAINNEITAVILIILAIVILDLGDYIRHWISHNIPLFWELHEFHHAATEMTIFNNFRNSLFEIQILNLLFFLPVTVLISALLNECITLGYYIPLFIILIDNVIAQFFAYFGHSSLTVIYPKPFSYFLMSPALHLLHHSNNPEHYNCNYGTKYVLWDKVFGSYLNESNLVNIKGYGVKNTQYNKYHPLYSFTVLPTLKFLKGVKNLFTYRIKQT